MYVLGDANEDEYPFLFYPLLLSNKALFSVVVQHLYKGANGSILHYGNSGQGLKTLISSLRGTASVQYHENIQNYVYYDGLLERNSRDAMQELLDYVLLSGNLRKIHIYCEEDLFPLKFTREANLAKLTKLSMARLRSTSLILWLQSVLPRLRLKTLEISFSKSDLSWDAFSLQKNTLKTLSVTGCPDLLSNSDFKMDTSFVRTFVAPQWLYLSSLQCESLYLEIDVHISLHNLRYLSLTSCRVEGWENLCKSLIKLDSLRLDSVELVGVPTKFILAWFYENTIRSLLRLSVTFSKSTTDYEGPWLSICAPYLESLRYLNVSHISADTLQEVLDKCTKLDHLELSGIKDQPESHPNNALVSALSRSNPKSLVYLLITQSRFSREGWLNLIRSCPTTVKTLILREFQGLTPTILRELLKLPIQNLELECFVDQQKEAKMYEHIVDTEAPPKLSVYHEFRTRDESDDEDW
jgi:hypothetical protein